MSSSSTSDENYVRNVAVLFDQEVVVETLEDGRTILVTLRTSEALVDVAEELWREKDVVLRLVDDEPEVFRDTRLRRTVLDAAERERAEKDLVHEFVEDFARCYREGAVVVGRDKEGNTTIAVEDGSLEDVGMLSKFSDEKYARFLPRQIVSETIFDEENEIREDDRLRL